MAVELVKALHITGFRAKETPPQGKGCRVQVLVARRGGIPPYTDAQDIAGDDLPRFLEGVADAGDMDDIASPGADEAVPGAIVVHVRAERRCRRGQRKWGGSCRQGKISPGPGRDTPWTTRVLENVERKVRGRRLFPDDAIQVSVAVEIQTERVRAVSDIVRWSHRRTEYIAGPFHPRRDVVRVVGRILEEIHFAGRAAHKAVRVSIVRKVRAEWS